MGKKIYIVWNSHYGEDGMAAVFTSRESAEICLEFIAEPDAYIEEIELDCYNFDTEIKRYTVAIDAGGEIDIGAINSIEYGPIKDLIECLGENKTIIVDAVTRSEAIKIAKERAEYIEKNLDKYPHIGKVCIFRYKVGFMSGETRRVMPSYNFYTGEMIVSEDVEFIAVAK